MCLGLPMNTRAATFCASTRGTRVSLLVVRLEPSGPPHCMEFVSHGLAHGSRDRVTVLGVSANKDRLAHASVKHTGRA